ncbi:MAG: AIR carboxylase family protein, partial [Candidatus Paceibacterota bacterium]
PVATVGLNGAKNAGVLAAQILAIGDETIAKNVAAYKEKQAKDVLAKNEQLQTKGYKAYLEEKK